VTVLVVTVNVASAFINFATESKIDEESNEYEGLNYSSYVDDYTIKSAYNGSR